MQTVWMVRWPQIVRKLAWWLALIGFDPHDHSLGHRIYLAYAGIFWSGWFFAMSSLFAGPALRFLKALGILPLNQSAAVLGALVLLGWGLYQLWQATRCSPFVFSEEDAYLICQSPLPRSSVAFAWFMGDWFEPAAPFWAGAVILSIALVDYRLENKASLSDLPIYISSAVTALIVVALVQLGLMALVWSAGALRLQGDRQLSWQPSLVRFGILFTGLGLAYVQIAHGLGGLGQSFWQALLWPLSFPLASAFGVFTLVPGVLVGLVWAGLGLRAVSLAGANLNLSRAAQETTRKEQVETAQRYGQIELALHLALTNRLGGERSPSRLPVRPGIWMLAWKHVVQSSRAFRLSDVWVWLTLFVTSLGAFLLPEPGARGLALAVWAIMAGERITARLQKDLAHWSLLRMLPFSNRRLLFGELFLPWMVVVLFGLLTLALARRFSLVPLGLPLALLLAGVSASITFAAAYDLLRQAQSEMLLNGSAPQISSIGGLLTIICLALPLGLWFWMDHLGLDGSLIAIVLALLLALFFWNLATVQLKYIE